MWLQRKTVGAHIHKTCRRKVKNNLSLLNWLAAQLLGSRLLSDYNLTLTSLYLIISGRTGEEERRKKPDQCGTNISKRGRSLFIASSVSWSFTSALLLNRNTCVCPWRPNLAFFRILHKGTQTRHKSEKQYSATTWKLCTVMHGFFLHIHLFLGTDYLICTV